MNTSELKKFAQQARRLLIEQVSARLKLVLQMDSAEIREKERAVTQLQEEIAKTSEQAVVERVAYIWFNRFCALRFMDVNRYSKVGTVSPAEGFSQPEILQEAKQGHIDEDLQVNKQKVFDLLGGKAVSTDPQQEAYRLLFVAVCNSYHTLMPFMFERIADFTELLMPDDLLSENSILHTTRNVLTEENCQDVEVIGWLYQFYISEKKDQVFEGLKKNKKITPENIPAATQLFTPHWIVRYLVENSLGRLWMLNRPQSRLIEQMEYYIKPEETETDFLKINSPEEIKICDPACGSGHMLTYAFDLLYAIYEEEGYDQKEISNLILTKNLYGIEIDERAGALAAFALTMKARQKYRRFFRKPRQPSICVLQNVEFDEGEVKRYMDEVGRDLFTINLQSTLHQFKEADNFGSLIRPEETNVDGVYKRLDAKGIGRNLFLFDTHRKVLQVLRQAGFLSPKYHVVIANPPYMGKKNMNGRLQSWLVDNYSNSCPDFFAAFIEKSLDLKTRGGFVAMITMDSWMFGDDYTDFRGETLINYDIDCLAHLGPHAFEEIKGEVVQVAAFILRNRLNPNKKGTFFDLTAFSTPLEKEQAFLNGIGRYEVSLSTFYELPRSVFAYFISSHTREAFEHGAPLKLISEAFTGLQTGDNERFIRRWSEISKCEICFTRTEKDNQEDKNVKWFPYVKGSEYRKWYGNHEFVLNWQFDGAEIKALKSSRPQNQQFYFRTGLAYNNISNKLCTRLVGEGHIFDQKNSMLFAESKDDIDFTMSFLHSKVVTPFLRVVAPKDFGPGSMKLLPVMPNYKELYSVNQLANEAVKLTKTDWDSYEASWDFFNLPLLQTENRQPTLKATYRNLRTHWQKIALQIQRLEEENNRTFIEAYGLQDELTPDVPLKEITLICNPHYRYAADKSEEELESLLLADTMKEFISYSVGCMFGRYSLDKPGLILANQGETVDNYLSQISKPTFEPDDDNVIPILDGEWFIDDIAVRFRKFLKVTFGEEHYEENLIFLEEAIGKDIRKYFLKDFYADHVKRYKKRPIYWQFSSPKGSFNALIYMHRYRPDTVSIILNDYLREFSTKLISRCEHLETISINTSASTTEKTKALKEIEKLKKTITELDEYERDILYPLATQKIEIDLDDGVKVNYPKFGKALKKVPGLS